MTVKKLVICYISIGEAENYRFFWQNKLKQDEPACQQLDNKNRENNYKVCY